MSTLSNEDIIDAGYADPFNRRNVKLIYDWIKTNHPQSVITQKSIADYVKSYTVNQVFYQRKVKHYFPIIDQRQNPFQRVQIDVMFPSPDWLIRNPFFVLIDTYSRYLIVEPIKAKNQSELSKAFEKSMDTIGQLQQMPPDRVDCDNEKGFESATFKATCAKYGINKTDIHYSVPQDHLALAFVDRVIRTLREMIEKEIVATGNGITNEIIEGLVKVYNNVPHRSTGLKPIDALKTYNDSRYDVSPVKKEKTRKSSVTRANRFQLAKSEPWNKTSIKIGDMVRVKLRYDKFEKHSKPRWSTQTYVVTNIIGDSYYHVRPFSLTGQVTQEEHWNYRKYDLLKVKSLRDPITDPAATGVNDLDRERKAASAKRTLKRVLAKEGITDQVELRRSSRDRAPQHRTVNQFGQYIQGLN